MGLTADTLRGNPLRSQHLMLEGIHRRRRLVDRAREGERCGEDRRQARLVLCARRRILVLDDQESLLRIDAQQLAGRQLVVEPVDGSILQIGQRIMARDDMRSGRRARMPATAGRAR